MVYIIGTLVSMLFSFIACRARKLDINSKTYKVFSILSAMPLTIIAGLRYGVGQDYFYTYQPYFIYVLNGVNNNVTRNVEAGFRILTKIIQIFSNDYMWLFFVCAIIISFFTFKAIYNESPNPPLSIFLFVSMQFYFISLNAMRQFIAISIFLYSIKYIRQRKLIPFLVLNLIGFLFHTSAIIFIPVYFLYNIKLTPKKSVVLLVLGISFVNIVHNFLYNIILSTKYVSYIGSNYDNASRGYITMLIQIFILLFSIMYYKKSKTEEEEKRFNFYYTMQLIATYISCIDGVLPLLARIRFSFGFPAIILIPMTLERENNIKRRRLFEIAICVLFTVYILYTIGVQNANNVLPYTWIFDR